MLRSRMWTGHLQVSDGVNRLSLGVMVQFAVRELRLKSRDYVERSINQGYRH